MFLEMLTPNRRKALFGFEPSHAQMFCNGPYTCCAMVYVSDWSCKLKLFTCDYTRQVHVNTNLIPQRVQTHMLLETRVLYLQTTHQYNRLMDMLGDA